jgi:type IVB pilus formation R64 PilN family outer membrane protein
MKISKKIILGLSTAMMLSGCSYGNVSGAEKQAEGSSRDMTRLLDQARHPLLPANLDRVKQTDDVYTDGGVARRSDRGSPLPTTWERPQGFTLVRSTPMQLFEIGTAITDITRLPVTFAPDVFSSTQVAPVATPTMQGAPVTQSPDLNSLLNGMGLGANQGGNTAGVVGNSIRSVTGNRTAMKVDFNGRLSQFLNQVSAQFGVAWEYGDGEIRIFRNITKTYTIHALPSNISLSSALTADNNAAASTGGTGGTSSGATGGSNQKVTSDVSIKIWDDITKAVNGIVGSQGTVTTAVSTGTITVTAPSPVISKVQSYLDGQNERLSRQVSVSIQVLSVQLTDNDNYTLDVAGLFSQAGNYGIAFGNAAGGAVSLAGGVLNSVTPLVSGNGGGANIGVANGPLKGTSALIQALSEKGRVSVKTTTSVTTLNGVPAPVQVANTRGYVASISVSNYGGSSSSGTTSQTSLTPGSVTTGFSMSLLPRIDPDGEGLLMQFAINLSDLQGAQNGFDTFSTNGSTIQLPNINSRNFVQQAEVPNGSTLVLTGFEQVNDNADRKGTGDPSFMGLGGSQVGTRGRTAIVILMTPTVVTSRLISNE